MAPAFAGPFVNADVIQRGDLGRSDPEAAYEAARIAEAQRAEIIARGGDLVTETVFSDPSKLKLVQGARARGYAVWVMHVGVGSADLSAVRVAHRVRGGGHDVPEKKVRARFDRSVLLIRKAVRMADVGLVYDNSIAAQPPKLVLTFEQGLLVKVRPDTPEWIRRVYVANLSGREPED